MAEMFVSPLVSLLIENLAPFALSFIPSGRIHRKIKKWTNMLLTIQAVLEDAEDRQLKDKHIQLWLKDVQKLAFEIEDVVDDLLTEAGRRQMIATPESSRSGKLRKLFSIFNPKAISFNYDLDRKIGEISDSLKELEERKNIMKLQKCVGGISENPGDQKLPSTSLVDTTRVYGRDEESSAILTLLLEDKASDHDGQVRVISIVGMGGIGKTTLAQSLYNNEQVKDSFHNRAWVCVTEDFDVLKISKIIYEEVSDVSCSFNELNKVQVKLREKLSNKKFFLVLDDVWNQDYAKWDLLCAPFHDGAAGSTIIVTTRSHEIAKIMGSNSNELCELKVLSDGDCLSLLAQHALGRPNFNAHPDFKEVAENIAKRCKGLPLAAKSLGGLLRTKGSLKQWVKVSISKIWELQGNNIIPALRLSYHHLPPYLKPLFGYCSLFPKGYEFNKQELIMLWMSQGFLKQSSGEQEQMEELGSEYFDELLSRSFFQLSTGNKSRYLMHDLNNDLAQFVAGLTYLWLDDKMVSNEQYKVSEEARHVSFMSHQYADFKTFKALNAARCLRTILPIRGMSRNLSYLSSLVFKDFPKLPCLRALSFNGYFISEVPKSIGDLNHLRYLDFSWTDITDLPESICDLYNLQTLLLNSCGKLVQLPSNIHRLINLRHLDIFDTPSLIEMPLGIGLLTHLRTLSKFIIGKGDGQKITELKGLHHLQGTISIIGIEKVMNVQDAMEANLLCKEGLHGLEMNWSINFGGTLEGRLELEVLEALKPRTGLACLEIKFYGGQKFPSWVGDHSFCDMVKVRLIGCKNCTYLPPLGQLTSLKELFIGDMDGVTVVGPEFLGSCSLYNVAFQSLIDLCFSFMKGWEEWCVDENLGAFPSLQTLKMFGCMKLKKVSLPKIPSLVSLELSGCGEMILSMVGVGSVKELKIVGISGFSKLDEGIIECLGGVEDLTVIGCVDMRYLWEEVAACQILRKLKSLKVSYCKELESLGDEEQLLPHNLESLYLSNCDKLEKMPNWQNNLTSLRRLTIYRCEKLKDSLVSTTYLERKIVKQGESSRSDKRLSEYEFSNLEKVEIDGCLSLKWFPMGKKLPTTLRQLSIGNCENLKEADEEGEKGVSLSLSLSLLESISFHRWSNIKSIPQGLTHLTRLEISNCSGIELIPETSLPPTLMYLVIWNCSNLKYMLCANEMQSLTSLRELTITKCENLEGYPSAGCWPPNLEYLEMGEVKQPIKEWGLVTLPTSLLTLKLSGKFPLLISFSEARTQLPSSLTRLHIDGLKNLESLGEGLQNLSSLQHLCIRNCSKLRELPQALLITLSSVEIDGLKNLESLGEGLQNLSSLKHLRIRHCSKLRNLPETLLPTLSSLHISECPIVEERCKKEKRDYWPNISHIPQVEINYQLMLLH